MQRKIIFSEGEFYHIYNRGVEKRKIFSDRNDQERFLRLLFLANSTQPFNFRDMKEKKFTKIDRGSQLVAIGSYCLMPNHFHLLVREIIPEGISSFMEKLNTGYSMYFNKRHSRVGPLFQGRFKAQHIERDEHLKYLFAYIHLITKTSDVPGDVGRPLANMFNNPAVGQNERRTSDVPKSLYAIQQ